MRGVYEQLSTEQTEIQRTIIQGTARLCTNPFGSVCKALWPHKTAEELASRVGCAVRTAAYEISGEREPSALSVLVVIDAIVPKRK